MRFLLSSIGSSGDLHPYIGIGQALRARGHDVAFISQPYFERSITDAGLEFIPAGERFDLTELSRRPEMMGARLGSMRILRGYLIPHSGPAARAALEAIDRVRPDAVFCHHMAWGAAWAAEKRAIPFAFGCLSPLIFISREDRCVFNYDGAEAGRGFFAGLRYHMAVLGCRLFYDPPLNRLRREFGVPPRRDQFIQDPRRANLALALWSPHFRPPMPDDPPNSRICGFVWFDRHRAQEHATADLQRFLDDGEEPILFTLGTTAVHVAGPFYQAAADACRILNRRGLLLTGQPEYAPHSLPRTVAAFSYAPYSAVLPRAAAIVHHGGIGTTAQAMRAGKPTVIVPFAHDQFDNAARARRLGISATVRRNQIAGPAIAAALRAILDDPTAARRAIELGRQLATEDGSQAAANHLETLAKVIPVQQQLSI